MSKVLLEGIYDQDSSSSCFEVSARTLWSRSGSSIHVSEKAKCPSLHSTRSLSCSMGRYRTSLRCIICQHCLSPNQKYKEPNTYYHPAIQYHIVGYRIHLSMILCKVTIHLELHNILTNTRHDTHTFCRLGSTLIFCHAIRGICFLPTESVSML